MHAGRERQTSCKKFVVQKKIAMPGRHEPSCTWLTWQTWKHWIKRLLSAPTHVHIPECNMDDGRERWNKKKMEERRKLLIMFQKSEAFRCCCNTQRNKRGKLKAVPTCVCVCLCVCVCVCVWVYYTVHVCEMEGQWRGTTFSVKQCPLEKCAAPGWRVVRQGVFVCVSLCLHMNTFTY